MGHIANQLGLSRRPTRKPQPYDSLTKADMWAELVELRRRADRAAGLANTLGRDARRVDHDLSDRAYQVRDVLRD